MKNILFIASVLAILTILGLQGVATSAENKGFKDRLPCGDVNADGCVTATDALIVLRTSIGLDDSCNTTCYE